MTDLSVQIGSKELRLFWKGDQCLRGKFLYLKMSSIGCKRIQRVHPETFLINIQLFEEFRKRPNSYFLWPTLLSELVLMKCASSERVTNVLEGSFFTWNDLVMAAKSPRECTPNHFWQIFSFLMNFGIGQTVTFYDRPFCPNWFTWTLPFLKGWPMS